MILEARSLCAQVVCVVDLLVLIANFVLIRCLVSIILAPRLLLASSHDSFQDYAGC